MAAGSKVEDGTGAVSSEDVQATETLTEFRSHPCRRCGMGSSAALMEHAAGFHDNEWIGHIGRDAR